MWYTDNFRTVGAGANILLFIAHIEDMVSDCGFYLEAEKSQFVWALGVTEDAELLEMALLDCSHREWARQLGGVCRSNRV